MLDQRRHRIRQLIEHRQVCCLSVNKIQAAPDLLHQVLPPSQHRQWVQEAISNGKNQRESCWTESVAVGCIDFVEETKARLGIKGMGRRIEEQEADRCVLREDLNLTVPFLTQKMGV